jgi:hypothetical protein
MAHDPQVWTALQQARAAWSAQRAATVQKMQDAATAEQAWADLASSLPAGDARVTAAKSAYDGALLPALVAARDAERQARAAVAGSLAAWLDADPAADVRTMSAAFPIALFPVRLETRFDPPLAPTSLKVRIYPDDIQSDTHVPELTAAEGQAGDTYWSATAAGLDAAEAWRRLLLSCPAPRAAYLVHATDPKGTRPASRPTSWTRPAETRLLPDRWIVVAYREGREIHRAQTNPVVEPLALTVSPLMGVSGDASGLGTDPDVGWAADFGGAVTAGMAVAISLDAYDVQAGFDRIVVVGVKATLAPKDAAAQFADLWRDHSYVKDVAFVAQGSRTNNTGDAPAAYPPDDPNGAASYALQFQAQPPLAGADGKLFMDALGLPPALAAPMTGASRSEQNAARAMSVVLWSATWGYYLREWMAQGFDALPGATASPITDAVITAARGHFLDYVRARGPLPAFRLGATPYGLLPATSLRHWTGFGAAPAATFDLVAVQVHSAAGPVPGWDEVRIGRSIHPPANGLYAVFEGGAPVPLMSSMCAFAVAGWDGGPQPDLYIVRKTGGSSQHTEFIVLTARSGYSYIAAQGATSLGLTDASYSFAFADWDKDKKPDLFAINRQGASSTEVSILSAASGFQTSLLQTATSLPKTDANWMFAVADWDKDGIPDLFAVQTAGAASQHVEVHVLSGASQFRTEILHSDTGVPAASGADVSVADWDGDGVVDVILALRNQPGAANLTVTVIQGAQQFKAALPALTASLPDSDPVPNILGLHPTPAFVLAGDWDGDGRAELLTVLNDGSSGTGCMAVTVLSAAPVMRFNDPARLLDSNRGTRATVASAAIDIDGDGSTDLILLQASAQTASTDIAYRIARGLDPCGVPASFSPDDALPAGSAVPTGVIGAGVAAADLDGDGARELIVFHLESGGNSRGSYRVGWKLDPTGKADHWTADVNVPGPPVTRRTIPTQRLGGSMTLARLDASGKPDMIVLIAERQTTLFHATSLYYVVGSGLDATGQVSGAWGNPISVPFTLSAGSSLGVNGIAVADVDADGLPDVVVSYLEIAASGNTVWYRVGWGLDATGNPQGGWSDPYRIPNTGASSIAGISLAQVSQGGWTGLLRGLVERYRRGAALVPRVGLGTDPDADLLQALALDASSRRVAIRRALGPNTLLNLYTYLGTQAIFQPIHSDWITWYQRVQRRARSLFQGLGDLGWNAARNYVHWDPRMADAVLDSQESMFTQPLVAPEPLSETAGLPAINNQDNYLKWLLGLPPVHPKGDDNANGLDTATGTSRWPLLFYLARHGLLAEYASAAFQIDVSQQGSAASDDQDPEFFGVVPGAPVRTAWNRLLNTTPSAPGSATNIPVWQYLLGQKVNPPALIEYRRAMGSLSILPTAELDRLVSETLDVCSHRVDCWVTSLATRRLQSEMRPAAAAGLYVGGFGWLENVVPAAIGQYTSQTVNGQPVLVPLHGGGYIHAPSAAMASTAAVLRNAYMSRGGLGSTAYAIDLSSERARVARELLDSVRQGVPLAAALGFRVERLLDGAGLQQYIDPLRHLYPLVPLQEAAGAALAASTVARTVVDGLALRAAWPNLLSWQGSLPDFTNNQQELHQLLDAELGAGPAAASWVDPLDAVADLLTAESVYQTIQGNKTGAVAALDAFSQGTRPPDPEILRQPRHGVGVTHRVAMILGDPPPAMTGWPAPTPRAAADPYLDNWVGSLLGDPAQVRCLAVATAAGKPPVVTNLGEITLASLGLRPLDVLELARTSSALGGASELDRRVAWAALHLPSAPQGATEDQLTIAYARDSGWPSTIRSLPEILELASSINAMLGRARPLKPVDLLAPENLALAAQAAPAPAPNDAQSRAQAAFTGFNAAVAALQAAVQAAQTAVTNAQAVQPVTQAAAQAVAQAAGPLRAAILSISFYNLPAAIPQPMVGSDLASVNTLLAQSASVLATASDRQKDAQAAIAADSGWTAVEDARAVVQTLFGKDMPFLAAFVPVEAHPGELAQAVGAQASLLSSSSVSAAETVRRWLMGAARVRPPLDLWRRASLYATALGAREATWTVAQLPYRPGDAWAGLPFSASSGPPRAGLVSLILDCVATPPAGGLWAGLMLDEWNEIVPSATAGTAVAFHYRSAAAQAPQAVLLAVPPSRGGQWDLETLLDIVNETLDLAHVRAVDASLAGSLSQFLPAAMLAYNTAGDTVSTDFRLVESAE